MNQREIEEAMWAGDVEKLDEIAGCICCCHEHTFRSCPARQWSGCRGQGTEQYDPEVWAKWYEQWRGMTREEFFG
jgi:hypothetical protein